MKNIYTSPEARLICFAAAEQLASSKDRVDFDDLTGTDNYSGVSTNYNVDVDVDIPLI